MDRRQFVRTTGPRPQRRFSADDLDQAATEDAQDHPVEHFVPAYDAWFDKYAKDWAREGRRGHRGHISLAT